MDASWEKLEDSAIDDVLQDSKKNASIKGSISPARLKALINAPKQDVIASDFKELITCLLKTCGKQFPVITKEQWFANPQAVLLSCVKLLSQCPPAALLSFRTLLNEKYTLRQNMSNHAWYTRPDGFLYSLYLCITVNGYVDPIFKLDQVTTPTPHPVSPISPLSIDPENRPWHPADADVEFDTAIWGPVEDSELLNRTISSGETLPLIQKSAWLTARDKELRKYRRVLTEIRPSDLSNIILVINRCIDRCLPTSDMDWYRDDFLVALRAVANDIDKNPRR
ncbi:MAG: hypothetical protein WCG98_09865 [bacterium]